MRAEFSHRITSFVVSWITSNYPCLIGWIRNRKFGRYLFFGIKTRLYHLSFQNYKWYSLPSSNICQNDTSRWLFQGVFDMGIAYPIYRCRLRRGAGCQRWQAAAAPAPRRPPPPPARTRTPPPPCPLQRACSRTALQIEKWYIDTPSEHHANSIFVKFGKHNTISLIIYITLKIDN